MYQMICPDYDPLSIHAGPGKRAYACYLTARRNAMTTVGSDEKRLLRRQKQLAKYRLLIIDEFGFVPLSKTGAELLFEIFSQRYERGSIMVTSNLPFDEWTDIIG